MGGSRGIGSRIFTGQSSDAFRQPVRLMDSTSLVKPTGAVTIDGITPLVNGNRVLFTSLGGAELGDNNKVFRAIVSGGNVTSWNLDVDSIYPAGSARDGNIIYVQEGTDNGDKLYKFTGTAWAQVGGGASGANQFLSNLLPTAINQSLIPDSHGTRTLGSDLIRWKNAFITGAIVVAGDDANAVQALFYGESNDPVNGGAFNIHTTVSDFGITNGSPTLVSKDIWVGAGTGNFLFSAAASKIDFTIGNFQNVPTLRIQSGLATINGKANVGGGDFTTAKFIVQSQVDTGPASATSVAEFGGTHAAIYNPASGVAGNKTALFFTFAGDDGIAAGISGIRRPGFNWETELGFYVNNITSGPNGVQAIQERMRLNSEGNLGIGTISPTAKLHVEGFALITGGLSLQNTSLSGVQSAFITDIRTQGMFSLTGTTIDFYNNINGQDFVRITRIADPINPQDAATRAFVLATVAAGGGANTTLSNLTSPTAINQDLIPSGSRSLGGFNTPWTSIKGQQIVLGPVGDSSISFASNQPTPSGATSHGVIGVGSSVGVGLWSINNNQSGSVNSNPVYLESGNAPTSGSTGLINIKTGNSTLANSGSINIQTGTAVGTRGNINLNAPQTTITGNLVPDVGGSRNLGLAGFEFFRIRGSVFHIGNNAELQTISGNVRFNPNVSNAHFIFETLNAGNFGFNTTTPGARTTFGSKVLEVSGTRGTLNINTTNTNNIATLAFTGPTAGDGFHINYTPLNKTLRFDPDEGSNANVFFDISPTAITLSAASINVGNILKPTVTNTYSLGDPNKIFSGVFSSEYVVFSGATQAGHIFAGNNVGLQMTIQSENGAGLLLQASSGIVRVDSTLQLGGDLSLKTFALQLGASNILTVKADTLSIKKRIIETFVAAGASAVIGSVPTYLSGTEMRGTEITIRTVGNGSTGMSIRKYLLVHNVDDTNPTITNYASLASGDSTINYDLTVAIVGAEVQITLNNSLGPQLLFVVLTLDYTAN